MTQSAYAGDETGLIFGENDEVAFSRSKRVAVVLAAILVTGLIWARVAILDEVSTGAAKVVPSMREQVIQSLEGGILTALAVRPDEVVEPGQVLAQLDPTRNAADVEETTARYHVAMAMVARLQAEMTGMPLQFPPELDAYPEVTQIERQLYSERRRGLEEKLALLDSAIVLTVEELSVNQRLLESGATSQMDVIRLRRQQIDLELQRSEVVAQYQIEVREALVKAEAEVASLRPVVRSRADVLTRLTLRSPVRGIVRNIEVTTIGGVIPPNGRLMDIIPLDDQLMIEARISPRDIAFIRPGLRAVVKISAYDYAIFGGLDGVVETISPDTIQDEANPEQYYYRVLVRTTQDALVNEAGTRFPIVPGMIATVDIHTGQKSVLDYLIQPFNRASEALRER